MPAHSLAPSENWDDDFEFGSNSNPKPKDANKLARTASPPLEPRLSVASSHFSEDWDAEDGSRQPSLNPKAPAAGSSRAGNMGGITSRLSNWVEAGPSTPTKRGGAQAQAENWDDDFEDKGDSPPGRRQHAHRGSHHASQHPSPAHTHSLRTRHSYHTPPRPKANAEPENWDDDFDGPLDPSIFASPSKNDNDNTPIMKRTRREAYADTSDEEDDVDFGLSEDKEEDKTVTARSRTAPMVRGSLSNSQSHASLLQSPPPVPPLPHVLSPSPIEPLPRSPTVSVFSIPTTSGQNSVGHFNSTSHLVLSGASSLAMLPPSPPQRERRRLRKKSRPPNMDKDVFELIEEQRDSSPPPLPPSTPERDRASSPPMINTLPSSSLESTPGGGGSRTPLLSRIGSVKKWGVRRKRASTGPAEVMMHEFGASNGHIVEEDGTPRPPSSLGQAQPQTPSGRSRNSNATGGSRTSWFFRPGGALHGAGSPPPENTELKHERSLEQARLRPGAGGDGGGRIPVTPSKVGKLSKRKMSGAPLECTSSSEQTGDGSSSASGVLGLGKPSLGPRRPTSMQVPNGVALTIGSVSGKFASVGTRHASYGSSVGRASASRVFSAPTPTESTEDLPPIPALPSQEGSRGFMGSVRKISLVSGKKHKKKKSSVDMAFVPPLVTATSFQSDTGNDQGRERDADGDARMEAPPKLHTSGLLPPIELHPPSPPQTINGTSPPPSMPLNISEGMESMIPSTSAPASITISPSSIIISPNPPTASPVTPSRMTHKTPGSPQSASLGRTAQAPNPPPSSASVPRRNSLGDLKIPARISQAQIGLKRDLGLVREFATSVDKLKELQSSYQHLLAEVQTFLENSPPSRTTSPTVFTRPRSRLRSHTAPPANTSSSASNIVMEHKYVALSLQTIMVKYKISWECAELLIELGGGAPVATSSPASGPSSSLSAPSASIQAELDQRKNRERAITLSGEESKSPPAPPVTSPVPSSSSAPGPSNPSWRASTGRHDLSQRQMVLLRDMLMNGELPPDEIPTLEENLNRNWRWGDAMNSTVTLPSEESESSGADQGEGAKKKRRGGRMGLTGLRDMLRLLTRSHWEQVMIPPVPAVASSVSLSTNSSSYSHHYSHGQLGVGEDRRASKTSTDPDAPQPAREMPVNSPYSGPHLSYKLSPRRPSLASIFRIGHRNKTTPSSSAGESSQDSRSDVRSASRGSNMTGDEEDWDRIETAIDLDTAARVLGIEGSGTVKGRKGRMSPFLSDAHSPPSSHPPPPPQRQQPQASGASRRPLTPQNGQDAPRRLRSEVEAVASTSPRAIRPMRSTRLSNVEEVEDGERVDASAEGKGTNRGSRPRTSPHRPPSRGMVPGMGTGTGPATGNSRTGSVRSAPPPQPPLEDSQATITVPMVVPEIKLSMTPENIKPLLENAKEVHVRCHECIRELKALVEGMPGGGGVASSG